MPDIMARIAVQEFSGYALWACQRRTKPRQPYAKADFHCGRTDNLHQAYGQVAATVAGLDFDQISGDWPGHHWQAIRDRLRQDGEKKRFEGATGWAAERESLGPDGLAQLAQSGAGFMAAWRAECQRRQQAERGGFMDAMESLVFEKFCRDTGRDAHDPAAKAAFRLWLAEGIEVRRREHGRTYQRFDFTGAMTATTRAADLALLGLASTANAGEIRQAWRRAAMRLHPDRGGNHQEFTRAKAAFERLSGDGHS